MNKLIRKITSVLLALTIAFTLSTTIFAAESEVLESQATCTHTWNSGYTEYIYGQGINATTTTCQRRTVTTKTCTKCGATTVSYGYSAAMAHSGTVLSATCNGVTQTHNCKCTYCNSSFTKKVACPGAPHSGSCAYLPV